MAFTCASTSSGFNATHFQPVTMTQNNNCHHYNGIPPSSNAKRRRVEDEMMEDDFTKENSTTVIPRCLNRSFVQIPGCEHVFQSEEWKPNGTALYLPIQGDTMINMRTVEQVTFGAGSCFVADELGTYSRSLEGNIINLWRFDNNSRQLYISRTLLFTEPQVYNIVRRCLWEM